MPQVSSLNVGSHAHEASVISPPPPRAFPNTDLQSYRVTVKVAGWDADLYGPTAAAADLLWMIFLMRAAHMVPGLLVAGVTAGGSLVANWCLTGVSLVVVGQRQQRAMLKFFCCPKKNFCFTVSARQVAHFFFAGVSLRRKHNLPWKFATPLWDLR